MASVTEKAGCMAFVVVLITSAFLLGFSFYVVEPNNLGIDYNKISSKLDTETLHQPGRIFLGVGHEMITFPTTQQSRDLGLLTGRSKDGLSVEFQCNYQFQYDPSIDKLVEIYLNYTGTHEYSFDYYAASVLRDTIAEYSAFEVITKRGKLSSDMENDVKNELAKYGVVVTALQLLQTNLPSRFIAAIEETVITEQNLEKASFSLEKAKINGETKRLTAEIDAGLIKVTAEAEATSALNKAEADAKAIKVQLESEKASYKALYDSIQAKYSGSGTEFGIQQLLAYMRTETITNTDAQAVTVAVDQVVV
mmetsp:Transcript_21572/g.45008  ORF Transcript_21572/g.45008 Transcript_21572/m.45008 type:complete len:308 (-) Transcript_21572:97-1020(-)|eukprot:CAMPEP_0118638722 /NCGR_PEP_ID=MMETSP0785-20121206/3847_1 /TAXON_ID=91992 /ORGANISM="Bolidomonas pacifica, Strain CCMP 1866" /LENGTH=307 /DNA_ID=CAMNT_0006530013 /DNA_START=63 /DNA_END=986 /DNA_ORIENTATION=+